MQDKPNSNSPDSQLHSPERERKGSSHHLIFDIWDRQPEGRYVFLSRKQKDGRFYDHVFDRMDGRWRRKVDEFIAQYAAWNIYFSPSAFSEPRRKNECAAPSHFAYADCDASDPKKYRLRPTYIIESSPGRYAAFWLADGPVSERLNQKLTYDGSFDKSGWDASQVLRVPGTINHKYNPKPIVQQLSWMGEAHCIEGLTLALQDVALPQVGAGGKARIGPVPDDDDLPDRAEVIARCGLAGYLKKFKKPPIKHKGPRDNDDRSVVLKDLYLFAARHGASAEGIFVVVRDLPHTWNRFEDPGHGGDDELWTDIERVLAKEGDVDNVVKLKKAARRKKLEGGGEAASEFDLTEVNKEFGRRAMDEVKEENIDWIYYPYLARGEVSLLDGDPGIGKSYLAQIISGYLCDGKKLPNQREVPCEFKVGYFDLENAAGSVTKKRLKWAGIVNFGNFVQYDEPFKIMDSEVFAKLDYLIGEEKFGLLVFDTVPNYTGKVSGEAGETTEAYSGFRKLARKHHCAVLCLRHLTKEIKELALYRGQGNMAAAGLARVIITVGRLPDDPDTMAFTVTKLNVSKPKREAMTYTIESDPAAPEDDPDRAIFEWGEMEENITPEMLVSRSEEDVSKKDDAKRFLLGLLAQGEMSSKAVKVEASRRAFNWRTVQRASTELKDRGKLKYRFEGQGKEKESFWSLREDRPSHARTRDRQAPDGANGG